MSCRCLRHALEVVPINPQTSHYVRQTLKVLLALLDQNPFHQIEK